VNLSLLVLWVVMPCELVGMYQNLRGTSILPQSSAEDKLQYECHLLFIYFI
jgi:hypothetical protein